MTVPISGYDVPIPAFFTLEILLIMYMPSLVEEGLASRGRTSVAPCEAFERG